MASRDMHDAPLEERVAVEQRIWDPERDRTFSDPSMLQLTYPSYAEFFGAYPEYRYVRDFFGASVDGRGFQSGNERPIFGSFERARSGARLHFYRDRLHAVIQRMRFSAARAT